MFGFFAGKKAKEQIESGQAPFGAGAAFNAGFPMVGTLTGLNRRVKSGANSIFNIGAGGGSAGGGRRNQKEIDRTLAYERRMAEMTPEERQSRKDSERTAQANAMASMMRNYLNLTGGVRNGEARNPSDVGFGPVGLGRTRAPNFAGLDFDAMESRGRSVEVDSADQLFLDRQTYLQQVRSQLAGGPRRRNIFDVEGWQRDVQRESDLAILDQRIKELDEINKKKKRS